MSGCAPPRSARRPRSPRRSCAGLRPPRPRGPGWPPRRQVRVPVSDPATAALLDLAGEVVCYRQADVTTRGLLGGEMFDGVVCNYGLTDIDDLGGLLANVARLLRSGGWFV